MKKSTKITILVIIFMAFSILCGIEINNGASQTTGQYETPYVAPYVAPTPEVATTPEVLPSPYEEATPAVDPEPFVWHDTTATTETAINDTEVYTTATGECYHMGWCSSLRRSKYTTTVSDAINNGFRACNRCHPPTE
jgi:hypothetical protein